MRDSHADYAQWATAKEARPSWRPLCRLRCLTSTLTSTKQYGSLGIKYNTTREAHPRLRFPILTITGSYDEQDTEVSGIFKLCAWQLIEPPDTDFQASVYEVGFGGQTLAE